MNNIEIGYAIFGAVILIVLIIQGIVDYYLQKPEPTLKQSLTRIKWLLGGILIVLIMLLRK